MIMIIWVAHIQQRRLNNKSFIYIVIIQKLKQSLHFSVDLLFPFNLLNLTGDFAGIHGEPGVKRVKVDI